MLFFSSTPKELVFFFLSSPPFLRGCQRYCDFSLSLELHCKSGDLGKSCRRKSGCVKRNPALLLHLSSVISFLAVAVAVASFAALLSIARNRVSSNCYPMTRPQPRKRFLHRDGISFSFTRIRFSLFGSSRYRRGVPFVNYSSARSENHSSRDFSTGCSARPRRNRSCSGAVDPGADNLQHHYPNTTAFVSQAVQVQPERLKSFQVGGSRSGRT